MRGAFTLIEVLIATLILALVGVGVLSLVTQSISLVREARDILSLTLVTEDLVTRDILGMLPDWEVRGEVEGFKWSKEAIPTQLSVFELRRYKVSKEGREVDFIIIKRK